MKNELNHCRHDPFHCLAPGLFRNFSPGERQREKLDTTYEYDGIRLRFIAAYALGVDDLRFLQGIVAFAGLRRFESRLSATSEIELRLRERLGIDASKTDEPRSPFSEQRTKVDDTPIMVDLKTRKLLQELGMATGGSNFQSFRESLVRMSNVTVYVSEGTGSNISEKSYHLLSYDSTRSMSEVTVALNPILAAAILGVRKYYTRIDFTEIRQIRSDSARLIHQRLCAQIRMGHSQKVGLNKLMTYVWGESVTTTATYRKRVSRMKDCLSDFERIGWKVVNPHKGMYVFKRPYRKDAESSD